MAARFGLLLIIVAVIERTGCQDKFEAEQKPLGYFKNSHQLLDTLLSQDYQDTIHELDRIARDYRKLERKHGNANLKDQERLSKDEPGQDILKSIDFLPSLLGSPVGKRRVRSQKMRLEKLNLQGVRSHRTHTLESGRRRNRRRLQPDYEHDDNEERDFHDTSYY